jgi:spore coat protein A, manganese oxidase
MMRPYEVLDNPNFNPFEPIPGECRDDAFSQCYDCGAGKKYREHDDDDESSD